MRHGRGPVTAASAAAILGCAGPDLGRDEAAFFRDADPWGFILFARNLVTPAQILRLTSALREAVGRAAPVLIDQEGGRVQRLRGPVWREWLPPLDHVARTPPAARARSVWLRYRLIAAELSALGIDVNCAVTGDIAGPRTHPFLRNRCFGEDAGTVIVAARAAAGGLLSGGVLPVVKHIPGHGRASTDSHHELPRVDASREALRETDFAVFAALADLPLGMTGHVVFTAIDPEGPATTSAEAIRLIRDEIGFRGLLMTDDISMDALPGTIAGRAAAAIRAGCDAVLHCNGDRNEMEAVVAAAGRMTPAARARADAALALRRQPAAVDIGALRAELEGLIESPLHG